MLSVVSLVSGNSWARGLLVGVGWWCCVACPWLVAWLAFGSLGGWPLNDDPFYAKPVDLWSRLGRWVWVSQYGALTASSVAHVAVGFLATVGPAFAYRPLFLAVIAQQSLGVVSLVGLARRLRFNRTATALVAGSLITFPLYYGHAFTFMTDGPATAWAAVGCAAGLWGAMRHDCRWLFAGSLATGWGYWIRQTDALILMVPLLTLACYQPLLGQSLISRRFLWLTACVVMPAALAIIGLESGWWFPSLAIRARDVSPSLDSSYIRRVAIAAYGWLLLSGWFSLPWSLLLIQASRSITQQMPRWAHRACTATALVVLLLGLVPWLKSSGRACLTNSTGAFIQNAHFGPIFLSDMDEPGRWGSLNGVQWPLWVWQLLSLLSLASTALMSWWAAWTIWNYRSLLRAKVARTVSSLGAQRLTTRRLAIDQRALAAGALSCLIVVIAASVLIVLLIDPHMDRYWMFLLPVLCSWWICLAALCRWHLTRPALLWGLVWLTLHLSISIVFTHDMLAWNNARWTWVNQRLAAGVTAREIDGGRDVNAWLRMNEDPHTSARVGDNSPWWSGYATEALAVGARPGWRTIDRLTWHAWATGRNHELLVLARQKSDAFGQPAHRQLFEQDLP